MAEYIQIIRGNDTNFNGETLFKIVIKSEQDLTGFSGSFYLNDMCFDFDHVTEEMSVNLTHNQTCSLPLGRINGTFILYDKDKKVKKLTTVIPFFVTNIVGTQTIDVTPYTITINVVNENGSVFECTVTSGSGEVDYDKIQNKPAINGVLLVGNKTSEDLGLVDPAALNTGLSTKQDALKLSSSLITTASWNTETLDATITTPFVTSDCFVWVGPKTDANRKVWVDCNIRCIAQGDGTLTYKADTLPTELVIAIVVIAERIL